MPDKIVLASCVIVDDYGRLLLLHRNTDDGSYWELPGNVVDEDELPESAAVRSVYDALGLDVRLIKSLGSTETEDDEHEYAHYWFQAQLLAGKPNLQDAEDIDDLDYFELEDTMSLALSQNTLLLLPKIIEGEVALDQS